MISEVNSQTPPFGSHKENHVGETTITECGRFRMMRTSMLFSNILERSPCVSWRGMFEHARRLKGFLIRIPLIISGRLTKESCISAFLFAKAVCRLSRKSGLLFTALYLKQFKARLQQYYGGIPKEKSLLPVMVSLTGSGIPRIIPPYHRKMSMRKDSKADSLVKWYLSLFSLSKVILLSKSLSKENLETITKPPTGHVGILRVCDELLVQFNTLQQKYLPWIQRIPVDQGMTWEPTWKSLPNRRVPRVTLK